MNVFRYRHFLIAVALSLCAVGAASANGGLFSWDQETDFLAAEDVFTVEQVQRQGEQYALQGQVANGYYVYRHSLKLVDAEGQSVDLTTPEGTARHDEFFGNTEIYMGDAALLHFPVMSPSPVTLHWQGCAEEGICYSPQTLQIDLTGVSSASGNDASDTGNSSRQLTEQSTGTGNGANLAEDQAAAQRLAALGPVTGTLLFFGFGLLLAFTPCTLPMIPIVSTLIVGNQAKPRSAFTLTLSYILAMAGTYAVVGVAAGLAGANLQAALQSPWLLGLFAALFLILASSLFGLFELRMPAAIMNRIESAGQKRAGGNIAGAAALGLLSALLIGPCMTAPLAGVLLYIGQTGSALQGGLALFALGLGMGLPLLAIAVFGARVLPKPGPWMDQVRIAFGYVMVGMAVMMLTRFLPGAASLALWGAWILSLAIGLVAWAYAVATRQRLAWSLRSGAAFAGLWSVLMIIGAASGGDSALQPLAHLRGAPAATPLAVTVETAYVQAKSVADVDARLAEASARGEWTLIDFYADWCVSCHVIERNVFGDPTVAARLEQMQVLRPDVTHNDATDQALLKHWGVMGPPTLILVGPDGDERRDLRMVGDINTRDFLERLNAAGTP